MTDYVDPDGYVDPYIENSPMVFSGSVEGESYLRFGDELRAVANMSDPDEIRQRIAEALQTGDHVRRVASYDRASKLYARTVGIDDEMAARWYAIAESALYDDSERAQFPGHMRWLVEEWKP